MKTIILTLALLIAVSTIGLAQCGKKVVLTTSKTDHIDKSNLTITINDDHKLSGTIKSDTCNWSVPFKNGKMVLTALITSENGEDRNVTITIEGKDGKVTLLFESKEEPGDRIRVAADKFEEAVN
jgi:predicted small lipoprotein YifL